MIVTFRNYPPLLANSLSCCLVYYFVHPFLFCLVLFRTAYSFPSSRSVRYPTDKRCCFVSTGLRPFISGERDRQTDRKKRKDRDELHIERGERKKRDGKKVLLDRLLSFWAWLDAMRRRRQSPRHQLDVMASQVLSRALLTYSNPLLRAS